MLEPAAIWSVTASRVRLPDLTVFQTKSVRQGKYFMVCRTLELRISSCRIQAGMYSRHLTRRGSHSLRHIIKNKRVIRITRPPLKAPFRLLNERHAVQPAPHAQTGHSIQRWEKGARAGF